MCTDFYLRQFRSYAFGGGAGRRRHNGGEHGGDIPKLGRRVSGWAVPQTGFETGGVA